MVLISYDIHNDKKRRKFNKYIRKFGFMLQYSVYEIDNSERILNNIIADIQNVFEKDFDQNDSIYIFNINDKNIIKKFGYASNMDKELLIIK